MAHLDDTRAQIDDAGRWCLEHFKLTDHGITLRAPTSDDAPAIREMERRAFPNKLPPTLGWPLDVYDPDIDMRTSFGNIYRAVALHKGGLGGYTILQYRNWGEVYGHELAARAANPTHASAFTSLLLIGVAARLAQTLGATTVTSHVQYVPNRPRAMERIVTFHARNGVERALETGLLLDGKVSDPKCAWLTGDPQIILDKLALRCATLRH